MSVQEISTSASEARAVRRILDAAGAHLVRHPRASLSEIAEAIGCGRTTLHRRYPTRSDLIAALALDAIGRLDEAFDAAEPNRGTAREALGRVLNAFVPLAEEFQLLSANDIWDVQELSQAWERLSLRMAAIIDRGKREGELRPEVPTALIVDAIAGMVWAVGDGVTMGRIAGRSAPSDLLGLLLDGIGYRPPPAT
jgi:AcrR family transcriptional regulator